MEGSGTARTVVGYVAELLVASMTTEPPSKRSPSYHRVLETKSPLLINLNPSGAELSHVSS
jgi:hypothetical protein